jgi:hypothetical protein
MALRLLVASVAAMLGVAACRKAQGAAVPVGPTQSSAAAADSATIAAFWAWFQKNATALHADKDLQRAVETISEALEKVHPGVFAEIGTSRKDRQLVISVDGKRELFPVVQAIYAVRPKIPGWTIVAFRPRSDPGFVIEMNGKKLDPKTMKVTAASDGQKLDINVFVPGFTTLEDLGQASFIVLDHLVGEYDMETRIGGIEWAAIERAPATARSLVDLPAILDKAFPRKR